MKLSGWYALFYSTRSYELFHGSELDKRYPKDKGTEKLNLVHFKSLREAKAYLYKHLNNELTIAKRSLQQVRSLKSEGRR